MNTTRIIAHHSSATSESVSALMRIDFGQIIGLLPASAAAAALRKGSESLKWGNSKIMHMNNH
jgi:hypothetical protein